MRFWTFLLLFFAFAYGCQAQNKGMNAIFKEQIFSDLEGTEISLFDLIQAHQGKVIFIDIWASWCGPCKQEMKYSKVLAKELAGQDVVFLYLSIDEQATAWKRNVKRLALAEVGPQYRRGQSQASELFAFLRARSIPRYLLFDKQGKPLNLDAPFPSEAECLEQIQQALKS